MTDTIDRLAGVAPGDRVDALRRHRPVTRDQSQASHDALFGADIDETHTTRAERGLVATFVAALHDDEAATELYAGLAGDLADAARLAAEAARTTGPYGAYREPGLAAESRDGLGFEASDALRAAVGDRSAAALEHAHLLVFRPREASPAALERLAAAGWSADGIVTLSQLVAFLAYQLRVAAGLRLLTEEAA
ncbi:CMD domain protein [Agromyces sp. G08B096]|uniref:CMD domain protein n=1 Tax=Agromyces sp. G08B096 TaxID=3156399 RepID=A0AAU7W5J6_9MICO